MLNATELAMGTTSAIRPPTRRRRILVHAWEQPGSKGIGDIGLASAAGLVTREDVTSLGAVLTGEAEGRRSADEITLFDSSGLAIQDLAIAKQAHANADELDLLQLDL